MKKIRIISIVSAILLFLSSCGGTVDDGCLRVETVHMNDRLLFDFTLSDLITGYAPADRNNSLPPLSQWEDLPDSDSPFSAGKCTLYRFVRDRSILTHPTICAYVPDGGERIEAITVDFDDHGYTDYLYGVYEDQCADTLRTVFPECPEDVIEHIYIDLNNYAYNEVFLEPLSPDTVPAKMYYSGGAGVFAYFAIGDYLRLCIVPVSPERLEQLSANGAELIDISSIVLP